MIREMLRLEKSWSVINQEIDPFDESPLSDRVHSTENKLALRVKFALLQIREL